MNTDEIKSIIDIIQAMTTITAIIVGGIWSYRLFIQRRQRFPRAKLEFRIAHRALTPERWYISVAIMVENSGEVLLTLDRAEVRIQQIKPVPSQILLPIILGQSITNNKSAEISWPLLSLYESRWRNVLEVEPGEIHELCYDFILSKRVETIKVYVFLENVTKKGRKIGWNSLTIYDLHDTISSVGQDDKEGGVR